jgi:lysine N6-hydroxylase
MRNIEFGSTVHDVGIAYDMLQIKTADRKYSSRMISIGIGTEPVMPEWLTTPRQQNVFLAEEILARSLQLAGKRVAVVGGGQTAAEVVLYLINSQLGEYAQLDWISRRQNFLPLDDTPFVNEFFTPQYVRRFHRYADIAKEQILRDQKIYADGITRDTLHALYAALYHDAHVRGNNGRVRLFPSQEVVGSTSGRGSTCLMARDVITHHKAIFEADIVIVCTGYRQKFPKFLEGLRARFEARSDGQLQLDENFKLVWDKPVGVEIFVQNGGRHTHGVADPQLCLAAWRSATILNAALGYEKYRVKPHSTFIRWSAEQEAAQDNASSIMVGDIVAEGDLSTEAIVSLKSKKAPLTPAFERTLRRVGEQ